MRLTARYLKWPEGISEDDISDQGVYKVRSLSESNSGKKYIHVWGWASETPLNEDWQLMVDGKKVVWH